MMRILAWLLAACLLTAPVFAATTPNSVVTPQTPNNGRLQFLNASTAGTFLTIYTAGANGSVCFGMESTNSETSVTHLVTVTVTNGAVNYGGAAFTTVAGAGTSAANPSPQSIMSVPGVAGVWNTLPTDGNGNGYLQLVSGDTLRATFATTVTSPFAVNLRVYCNDF